MRASPRPADNNNKIVVELYNMRSISEDQFDRHGRGCRLSRRQLIVLRLDTSYGRLI